METYYYTPQFIQVKNMNNKLSIIIPSYNEFSNTIKTINNIFKTCSHKDNIEIIVVNDNSNENYSKLSTNNAIKYIANPNNLGTSQSRDIGIKMVDNEYVLTIDSHMIFYKKYWDKEIIKVIKDNQKSILCFSCINIANNKTYYAGGFHLFNLKNIELSLSPFLLNEFKEEEIPCVVGGAYAFNKNFYNHLNGMEGMVGWGVGETFLSIKSYLAGGNCKLIKNVKIGHSFEKGNYTINKKDIYYNKLFLCNTILPLELSSILLNLLPQNKEKEDAIQLFKQNSKEIFRNRIMYENIFNTPFADYVKKFNLDKND